MSARRWRPPSLLLRLLVSGALLVWMLSGTDLSRVGRSIAGTSLSLLGLMALMGILELFLSSWNWYILLRALGERITILKSFLLNFMGFFFNTFLPGGILGDFKRAYDYSREVSEGSHSWASVIVERLIALGTLVALSLLTVVVYWRLLAKAGVALISVLFVAALVLAYVGFWILVFWAGGPGRARVARLPGGEGVGRVAEAARAFRNYPGPVAAVVAINLGSLFLDCTAHYVLTLALHYPLPLWLFFGMVPLIRLLAHAPFAVHGVGLQEVVFVYFLAAFGYQKDATLTISLVSHVMKAGVALLGALVFVAEPPRKESS